jgi:hypothetical protein
MDAPSPSPLCRGADCRGMPDRPGRLSCPDRSERFTACQSSNDVVSMTKSVVPPPVSVSTPVHLSVIVSPA